MSIGTAAGAVSTIEGLISQVRGVIAVRVVRNDQDHIEEIHVVGSPERSAKQMVRDVESILYVRGGMRVDHRKISLVQIAEVPSVISLPSLQLLDAIYLEQESAVAVTLAVGDRRMQGMSYANTACDSRLEYLAGAATIQALTELIGPGSRLCLENVQRQPFGQIEVCLSHLSLTTDKGSEPLLGISAVHEDGIAAAARAVLDAVNRRSQWLMSKAPARED